MLLLNHLHLHLLLDGGDELERSENLVDVCSDNGSGVNSQPVEDTDDVGDDPASKYSTYCSSNENKDSESSREGSTSGNCSKRSMYNEGMLHPIDEHFYFHYKS